MGGQTIVARSPNVDDVGEWTLPASQVFTLLFGYSKISSRG
jgi:hypothetical protein